MSFFLPIRLFGVSHTTIRPPVFCTASLFLPLADWDFTTPSAPRRRGERVWGKQAAKTLQLGARDSGLTRSSSGRTSRPPRSSQSRAHYVSGNMFPRETGGRRPLDPPLSSYTR